jgi:hypothetical protein
MMKKSVITVLIILTIISLIIVEVPGYRCTYTIGLCTYGVRYIRPYIMYLLIYVPHLYEYLRMYLVVSCNQDTTGPKKLALTVYHY